MTNADIARVFERIAIVLELDGANPFRVRAYREAARVIGEVADPLATKVDEEGGLEGLPGIGKDLAQKIRDLVRTGTTALYEEMKQKFPPGLIDLTDIQGLGPKRVRALYDRLGIASRTDLERAARAGALRDLPGFGEKSEQKILKSLERAPVDTGRTLLAGAWPVAQSIAERLRLVAGVEEVEIAGSFRRRRETIGDLDVLVCSPHSEPVMQAFVGHPDVADILGQGETKSSVKLRSGLQVDVRVVPRASFGAALLYFTGSKAHNIELRRIAIDKGLTLNEYGLSRGETDGERVAGRTEEEVYRALDLPWIPPELREATGEIELARAGAPPRLIELEDLRADLHMHSDRSDGQVTLETMVRACRTRGYAYCAITEHSKSLAMTKGFDGARVRKSVAEIEAVRRQVPGIEVLHGLEVDILAEGALDLEDAALELLDWVIVSLHSRLDQPRADMTARVLGALEHPAVCAMGHPSARLIGTRPPAELDYERVFDRAAGLGVAMEINAQPDRMDLSDVHARLARERGVRFVIDTDAHSVNQLDHMRYGVFVARRAGLTKMDVLNTLPLERFRKAIRKGGTPATSHAAAPKPGPARKPAAKPAAARKAPAKPAPARKPAAKKARRPS
jgi:DNA polymerase (family 10)